jgi:hypothetical protein
MIPTGCASSIIFTNIIGNKVIQVWMPLHQCTPHGETAYRETAHGETASAHDVKVMGTHEQAAHGENTPVPQFQPSDLVGQRFLMKEQEDAQRFHARIVEGIRQYDNEHKFRVSVNDDQFKEILSYNDILNFIE